VKVLLVYSLRDALTPRRPLASLGDIHIGLSYVSAALKSAGHYTRLVVLGSETPSRSFGALEGAMAAFDPSMVAFTAVSTQFPFIREAARRLKQRWPDKFLLVGGAHASLAPEEVTGSDFDAICVGEGELPAIELAAQLEAGRKPGGIANLWFKRPDGSIEKNPIRNFVEDLNSLPALDREMWHEWIMARQLTNQVVLPSRGCPYNCSYCSNHALRKLASGKYVRLRAPAAIVQEIRDLIKQYPETREIYLQSETIAVNITWLDALSHGIAALNAGLAEKISFTCNFRVARQFLNDRIFVALKRANVRTLEIGLESGSERVRCEALRRHYSNTEFFQAVELARCHGMEVNVYNMIGLPGETLTDHWETIKVNRKVCPSRSLTSIFFPYPGTDLYETCKEKGLLPRDGDVSAERFRAMLGMPGFSRKQIQNAYDWFEYRVYRGKRPWHHCWRKVLRNKAYSHHWSHFVFMRLLPLWYAIRGRS
jgi:anaerobic magnesium-protoporphyrin IX monomethyl ester cyclase